MSPRHGRAARASSATHGGSAHGGHGADVELVIAPWGRRAAVAMVVPLVLATVLGLVLLWPDGDRPAPVAGDRLRATVVSVAPCPDGAGAGVASCVEGGLRLDEGPEEGQTITLPVPAGRGAPEPEPGDLVVVTRYDDVPVDSRYEFADFQRGPPLVLLGVVFALAVVALARWRGVAALAGLVASLLVLVLFLLPALVEGRPPLWTAVVGASAIMIATLYLTHGASVRTSVALVGTVLSLALTGVLGAAFTAVARFTGFGDEASAYLATIGDFDVRGLLLAGLVIGALGVLDDVTVTQTAAVWEVAAADPLAPRRRVFAAGMRIGREHAGAAVNTLVLAYAGAALPSLVLFTVAGASVADVVTTEIVAQEVLRSLVGSLGLLAAVPLTTALAALVVAGHSTVRSPTAGR